MPRDGRAKEESRDAFLIVDDSLTFASSLRRLLSPYGAVTMVHSVAEAVAAPPPDGGWTALFLDFELPDGDGLSVVDQLRARGERSPALIITGHLQDHVANRAFELGVKVLAKPIGPEHVRIFLDGVRGDDAVGHVLEVWRTRYELTAAETSILRDGLDGVDRGTLAQRRGISETTLRTHVRHMLQKTQDVSLSDAIQRALREVIVRKAT